METKIQRLETENAQQNEAIGQQQEIIGQMMQMYNGLTHRIERLEERHNEADEMFTPTCVMQR